MLRLEGHLAAVTGGSLEDVDRSFVCDNINVYEAFESLFNGILE